MSAGGCFDTISICFPYFRFSFSSPCFGFFFLLAVDRFSCLIPFCRFSFVSIWFYIFFFLSIPSPYTSLIFILPSSLLLFLCHSQLLYRSMFYRTIARLLFTDPIYLSELYSIMIVKKKDVNAVTKMTEPNPPSGGAASDWPARPDGLDRRPHHRSPVILPLHLTAQPGLHTVGHLDLIACAVACTTSWTLHPSFLSHLYNHLSALFRQHKTTDTLIVHRF